MYRFAAFLFDGAERNEIARSFFPRLFFEFESRARQQIFAGLDFTFRNRPDSFIFSGEERAAGMSEKKFEDVGPSSKEKQAGANPAAFLFFRRIHSAFLMADTLSFAN